MIVWRLEFPDGSGAYQGRWEWKTDDKPAFLRDMYWAGDGPDPHPAPSEDGLGYIEHSEFFGFVSTDQVLAWFFRDHEEDARRYASRGMTVTVWEVDEVFVRQGHRQCVFTRSQASLVGRWEPAQFLAQFPSNSPAAGLYIV